MMEKFVRAGWRIMGLKEKACIYHITIGVQHGYATGLGTVRIKRGLDWAWRVYIILLLGFRLMFSSGGSSIDL